MIALPPGQTGLLRPVIALHGKDGNAGMMLDLGVEEGLAQLVKSGKPPFAVVGVDGGKTSYWHRRASGGTPAQWCSRSCCRCWPRWGWTPPG
ncbi:putative cONSERVED EXPORTED PROTEIN [Mycobacterium ulcerans str. Harvey]|uniref:CONSERVED EXPORTED PROTEIN n=1 Tax=Mycobacterium ulcerans str. Harvey TaxID=1299332 RepID=A0ABP3AMY4_MYCUL|nr:putative cONSERVED EXPORTED PROTEIN [Mycobacterium ulcerans str. Harvey]